MNFTKNIAIIVIVLLRCDDIANC